MPPRKISDAAPQISHVSPEAAIPGGELRIRGKGFAKAARPRVLLGENFAPIVVGSDSLVIARVPEDATGELMVASGPHVSLPAWQCDIGIALADGLHPVSSPAVDHSGQIFTTFSGSRGQSTPVSVYRIDPRDSGAQPFLSDIMNATGLAFHADGNLYVSSRHEGIVYQVSPRGEMSVYVEGMGVATGLAFDEDDNLYVGDRSGTIFKISRDRQIYVFATIEPSVAAYHLAFGPAGYLYVTGPTTSSYDCVHRISRDGEVEVFFRGLGRPQGLAFDIDDNLYVAASHAGRRGIVRLTPDREPSLFVSGPGMVGLAFTPSGAMAITTTNTLYRLDVGITGRPLY
ncbi:MAG: IPT/TIG domain-containing protein [Acidobacteriaceae bacterium]|nr:IPT/TIG domain-containing protein [Acidobacteriaceae bacterium]